jgi:hypothetical protein
MRDVRDVAGQKVVDPDDGVVAVEQGLGKMRPDESGGSGDYDSWLHKFGHLVIWSAGH